MASATVNGTLALDFSETKNVDSRGTTEDSPASGGEYDDSALNESPYQELCGEEEENNSSFDKRVDEEKMEAERLHAPMKKRRKQSNPVRIASSHDLEPEPVLEEQDINPLDLLADLPDGAPCPDNFESLFRCPHCNALFGVEDHLRIHIEEEHVQKLLERQLQQHQNLNKAASSNKDASSPVVSKESDLSGSSFHNIMSEAKETMNKVNQFHPALQHMPTLSHDSKELVSMIPSLAAAFGPPPFLIPLLSQGPTPPPSGNTPTGPPIRIFNPEAYCEICNKEFCNKYFLKTHKANKHGIYSVDTISGSPFAGTFVTSSMTTSPSMRSLPPPPPSTSIASMESGTPKSSGPLNAEAYCEICQKEFCNKYFLRKHKQKIHGICEFSTPVSSSSGPPQGLNGTATTSPGNPLDSPISNSSSSSVASVTTSNNIEAPNDMYNKDSKSTMPNPKFSPLHGPSPTPSSLPPVCSGYPFYSSSFVDEEKGCISRKFDIKPGIGVFSPEKLREIGVINADAFCELCCKEFCNKYFLRTHKLNKHGISIPEGGGGGNGKPNTPPGINLNSSDKSNSNNDEDKKLASPKNMISCSNTILLDGNIPSEETCDITCDVCGRPFASIYLLKMHKFYSHNIPAHEKDGDERSRLPPDASVKEEPMQDSPENLVKNETMDHPGEDLRKLQSMIQELNAPSKESTISCNVCHKEMENKYFLRAHMMNEHGILHSEETFSTNQMEHIFKATNNMSKDQNTFGKVPLPLPPTMDAETSCDICKKDFGTKYFLHIHKTNVHSVPMDLSMPQNSSETVSSPANQNSKPNSDPSMPTLTPVSNERPSVITGRNYCEICNKELCNKYFMKTHMLKMHGINIEDRVGIKGTATIGGVTCDICQKELCSKYFLKVHKQNTHGIFEENAVGGKDNAMHLQPGEKDHGIMPGEITDDNSRYYSQYTEICPICDRRFKSVKWLKTHMSNDHSELLKESPNNPCSDILGKNCLVCGKTFSDAVHLQVHMITTHYSSQNEHGLDESTLTSPSLQNAVEDLAESSNLCNQNLHPALTDGPMHKVRVGNGTRVYHCSYCAYATRWLSNLYAHEKRHVSLVSDADKKFPCRLCPRAYRYNHSLQRHMLSHRGSLPRVLAAAAIAAAAAGSAKSSLSSTQTLLSDTNNGTLSQSLQPAQNENESQAKTCKKIKKYRCSKCMMKFRSHKCCLAHIHDVHNSRSRGPLVTTILQKGLKIYKCRKCGFNTRHLNILKQHIRQQHRELLNPHSQEAKDSISAALDQRNKEMPKFRDEEKVPCTPTSVASGAPTAGSQPGSRMESRNSATPNTQLPMTYAMPQNPPSAGSFIMQPFLMAQPLGTSPGVKENGTFVPSLVYLPVCHKVSEPVTIAFTLTPA